MSTKNSRFTRRDFLKSATLLGIGASVAACKGTPETPPTEAVPTSGPTSGPAAAATSVPVTAPTEIPELIKGGPLEVGVLYEEGKWFDLVKEIGDGLESDYPGTKITYTFCNTASDAARTLRWQAGDPLDIDTNKFCNKIPATFENVDLGYLLDLTPFIERPLANGEKPIDAFLPLAKSFCVDDRSTSPTYNKWFSLPENIYIMLIHYNKKAFEEMGVEPATNWTEFLELCAEINEKGQASGMKPIGVSNLDIHIGQWWDRIAQRYVGREVVENILYGSGFVREDPGFLAAAKELEKLPANGWLLEGFQGMDHVQAQSMFFQGKAAMFHQGSWLIPEMADAIPEGFEVGIFDFPVVLDGKGDQKSLFGGGQFWSIADPEHATSHEVNAELAFEYLRRFTGPEAASKRATELGAIAPVKGAPSPDALPGVDQILASASADMTFLYYGVYMDSALWAAWYPPVAALFFGEIDSDTMIERIDEGLTEYRELKAATPTS